MNKRQRKKLDKKRFDDCMTRWGAAARVAFSASYMEMTRAYMGVLMEDGRWNGGYIVFDGERERM